MRLNSGAKSHFIDYAQYPVHHCHILLSSQDREEYSCCQNLSAVDGEWEAFCSAVIVWIKVIRVDA